MRMVWRLVRCNAAMSRAKFSYGKVKKLLSDPVMLVVVKTWRSGWCLQPEVVQQWEMRAPCKLRYIIKWRGHTPPSGFHLCLATYEAFVTKPHDIFLHENNYMKWKTKQKYSSYTVLMQMDKTVKWMSEGLPWCQLLLSSHQTGTIQSLIQIIHIINSDYTYN